MTSSIDLEHLAIRNKIHLNGIYPKDLFPKKVKAGGYIINLENHDEGDGTHWTALWIEENKHAIYFDSFGIIFPEFVHTLNIKKPILYNTQDIQDINDGHCGQYSIFFLWFMQNSKKSTIQKFHEFVSLFSKDPHENLKLLKKYLRQI